MNIIKLTHKPYDETAISLSSSEQRRSYFRGGKRVPIADIDQQEGDRRKQTRGRYAEEQHYSHTRAK